MKRNSRFFLRPLEDVNAGGMTSVHSVITLKGRKLRGEIHIRDCDNQISLDFWTGEGARPGGRARMHGVIEKLINELQGFAAQYDQAADEIGEQ